MDEKIKRLLELIRIAGMEQKTAQLSGLETGFEHPNTQRAFMTVVKFAAEISIQQPVEADENYCSICKTIHKEGENPDCIF